VCCSVAYTDPVRKGAVALQTGGWERLAYFRLHGSPRMYYSAYQVEFLAGVARAVEELPEGVETWVVFDNTAAGEAFGNAVELMGMIADQPKARRPVTREGKIKSRGLKPKSR